MGQNKEQLKKLLDFIHSITKQQGNEWFVAELGKICCANNSKSLQDIDIQTLLQRIEKYLKIDGIKIIDYSEVQNEMVRTQLFRDCIEMSKYRLGKINDTINFDEYCRYAHLQAEEMINYFYNTKYSKDTETILKIITEYSNYKIQDTRNIDTVTHIEYTYKLTAFSKEYGLSSAVRYSLDFINKLRNEMSHRSSLDTKKEDEILIELKNKNIDVSKYRKFEKEEKDLMRIYFEGKFVEEKRKQDFLKIIDALNELKNVVLLNLKKQINKY
jgi:hypothetical protein